MEDMKLIIYLVRETGVFYWIWRWLYRIFSQGWRNFPGFCRVSCRVFQRPCGNFCETAILPMVKLDLFSTLAHFSGFHSGLFSEFFQGRVYFFRDSVFIGGLNKAFPKIFMIQLGIFIPVVHSWAFAIGSKWIYSQRRRNFQNFMQGFFWIFKIEPARFRGSAKA